MFESLNQKYTELWIKAIGSLNSLRFDHCGHVPGDVIIWTKKFKWGKGG